MCRSLTPGHPRYTGGVSSAEVRLPQTWLFSVFTGSDASVSAGKRVVYLGVEVSHKLKKSVVALPFKLHKPDNFLKFNIMV